MVGCGQAQRATAHLRCGDAAQPDREGVGELRARLVSEVMVQSGAMTWSDVDPDAVVVVDRDASASLSRNNPWHERKLPGAVTHTFLRGVPTVVNGELA